MRPIKFFIELTLGRFSYIFTFVVWPQLRAKRCFLKDEKRFIIFVSYCPFNIYELFIYSFYFYLLCMINLMPD